MRPVGLALKRSKKKYARPGQGELMLIHLCVDCGKVSLNRIAADDDSELIFEVYTSSFALDEHVHTQLYEHGVDALQSQDIHLVQAQLFGAAESLAGVQFYG
jgi:hypothetical protein